MEDLKLNKTKEVLNKFGLDNIEIDAIINVIDSEVQSELLNMENTKNNEKQKVKNEKTDEQKRKEIMSIKDSTKRTREIAKNIELFKGVYH